jgi:hypothetical protein
VVDVDPALEQQVLDFYRLRGKWTHISTTSRITSDEVLSSGPNWLVRAAEA